MFTWKDVLVEEQRRKDMIERSEAARMEFLLEEPDSATREGMRPRDRWLFALGEQLVRIGCRMQARTRKLVALQGVAAGGVNGSAAASHC
ncbi:MAG: hypothetical protein DWG76_06670 [Chloroflexi bacterium]|nr:hypothetical protein [Chloroflexota bacterium]